MEAKKISKFSIVGHSLGGYIGGHFLNKYPDKVDKLFLVSPGGMNKFAEEHQKDTLEKVEKMNWFSRCIIKHHLNKIFEKKVKI